MGRRRILILPAAVLVLGIGALAVQFGSDRVPAAKSQPTPVPGDLVGGELAAALSLGSPVATDEALAGDCYYFAELQDAFGYCLDAVADDPMLAWELQVRITGHVPTAAERRLHEVQLRIDEIQLGGSAKIEEELKALISEAEELTAQVAAEQAGQCVAPTKC